MTIISHPYVVINEELQLDMLDSILIIPFVVEGDNKRERSVCPMSFLTKNNKTGIVTVLLFILLRIDGERADFR